MSRRKRPGRNTIRARRRRKELGLRPLFSREDVKRLEKTFREYGVETMKAEALEIAKVASV